MRGMRKPFAGALLAVSALVTVTACGPVQQPPPSVPSPTATTPSTANWVHFRWPAAGIAALVPTTPSRHILGRTVDGIPITLQFGYVNNAQELIVIGGATFGVAIPSQKVDAVLQGSLKSFASLAGTTASKDRSTTFRGLPARTAVLKRNTILFTMLIFQRDATHEVFVFAPRGFINQTIIKSLRLL